MLKTTAHSIAPGLTNYLTYQLELGGYHYNGRLHLLFRSPSPRNYRPISLLPVVSELLERHMYSLVSQHLAERNLISDAQWGFTPGKSTIAALLSTFHDILQFLEYGTDVWHRCLPLCLTFLT